MNRLAGEATQRSIVVVLGTLAVVTAIILVVGVLPRRRDDQPSLSPPTVEVGLVELPVPAPPAPPSSVEPTLPEVKVAPPPEPPPAPEALPIAPPRSLLERRPPLRPAPVKPVKSKPAPVRSPPPTEVVSPTPTTEAPAQPIKTAEPVATPAEGEAESGGTTGARAIFQPTPEVPPELRRRTMKFVAVVQFAIAADGSAKAALREATPDPRLNRILVLTFGKWRFLPAMERGKPVASMLTLRVPISVE